MLILSCDKYSDLWDGHVKMLNQYWFDREFDTYIVTDKETTKRFDRIEIYSAGLEIEFSQRLKKALEFVKTKYVFITLDDYFLVKHVDNTKMERLISVMEFENIDYIRLFPDPNSNSKFKNYKKLYSIKLNRNYTVNLYQGIWAKSFLESTVYSNLNAWQYEVSLTKIARESGAKCVLSKGLEFQILDVVRKGKILHKAARYFKKNDIYHGNREIIKYKEEIRIKIFSIGKKILPRRIAIAFKKLLKKIGFIFFSESI